MKTFDHATLSHWLDLDVDGGLDAAEKRQLRELQARDPSLAEALGAERRELEHLHSAFAESRIPVHGGFQDQVMDSLGTAAWEPSTSPAWRLPVAMMLFLTLGAALAFSTVAGDNPIIATGTAIADFVQSTALAGAGITLASWRGAGLGLEELMATSSSNIALLALMVLCLDLLFLSLLLRRRRRLATQTALSSSAESSKDPAEERLHRD